MAEIPADVFQYSIQSQINNMRHSNKVTRDIIALLNDADAEILAKLEKWGDSQRFSPARLRALLKEIRAMVSESYAGAHEQIKGDMAAFADHVAVDTASMIATQAPIAYNVVKATSEQLAAIVDTTPVTVGPEKKLLLEEVFSSLASGKEEDIRGAIRLSMVEGESIGDMTKRLRGTRAAQFKDGVLEVSRRHAETMVRTIVNSTSNHAMQAVYKANEAVVKGWRYLSTLDGRTSLTCRTLANTFWNVGEGPIPPNHPGCRSVAIPELKTFRELGLDIDDMPPSVRASKNGPVDSSITMDAWMRTQSKADIVDMLGPTRAKLFLDGKLDIQKFATSKGEVYTLSKLKQKNAAAFAKAFG